MIDTPDIYLYMNVIQDTDNTRLIGALENVVSYRQSHQANLGYYMCYLTVANLPDDILLDIFYSSLGTDLKAKSGGILAWEGMVYDVTLNMGSQKRNRSFDEMANWIKVTYTDANNDVQTSAAAQQANSVALYGHKEEIITLDAFDQTPAENRRDTILKQTAWPQTRVVGPNTMKDHSVDILAVGYGWTLNWKYTSTADDSTSDVSTWIEDIIDSDSEYVTKAKIASNSLAVKQMLQSPARSWDVIEQLTDLGDSSNNFYQAYVDDGRKFYYRQIETNYEYIIKHGNLRLRNGAAISDPWQVRPGVVRDMDYPNVAADPGSYFSDARDFFVEEVEISTGGIVTLKSAEADEVDLIIAQNEFTKRQSENDDTSGGDGTQTPGIAQSQTGERDRLNWKRKIKLPREDWEKWEKMDKSERWLFRKEKLSEWKANKRRRNKKRRRD